MLRGIRLATCVIKLIITRARSLLVLLPTDFFYPLSAPPLSSPSQTSSGAHPPSWKETGRAEHMQGYTTYNLINTFQNRVNSFRDIFFLNMLKGDYILKLKTLMRIINLFHHLTSRQERARIFCIYGKLRRDVATRHGRPRACAHVNYKGRELGRARANVSITGNRKRVGIVRARENTRRAATPRIVGAGISAGAGEGAPATTRLCLDSASVSNAGAREIREPRMGARNAR